MWNSLELECPVDDLVAYPPPDHCILENLRDFVTVLTTSADILTSESPLWNEIKVLNNIQAKYKRILHCDRFLIFLHRVGHCVRKMVLLNLSKTYLDLAERFLVGFQNLSGNPCLPSRQQVEYVLIRTLSASQLVSEAITYTRESFCYLIQKLKVGHLILDLIMATSIVARLNILLRATLEKLSSMYKQVIFWRYKVKKGEFQWAKKFDFPQDVEEWIKSSDPAYSKPLSVAQEDINKVKQLLDQTKKINNKVIEVESDAESVVLADEASMNNPLDQFIEAETDFGEVIDRKEDGSNQKSKKAKVKNKKKEEAKKKINFSYDLTNLQKDLLTKLLNVQSLKQLEELWNSAKHGAYECFPGILTKKRREKINKFLIEVKDSYPSETYSKTYKTKPEFLKIAILNVCKRLGFSNEHIKMCRKKLHPDPEPESNDSSDEIKVVEVSFGKSLVPVKTIENLEQLYKQLTKMLTVKKKFKKLKSLKTIFNHRIIDIKRLKENGENKLARKLICCTSKEFLALYK